jgi:hypothetical protein
MTPGKPSRGKVIVFGLAFWYPLAGVTFQFLHYLIGLRRLGYDVYYVEDSGRWVYDPAVNDMSPDAGGNIAAVAPVLEAHGFADRWAFRGNYPGGRTYGMSETEVLRLYRECDAFLNVTGAQEIRDEHLAVKRRVYVESDPVASQVRVAQGDRQVIAELAHHDTHFTFGENLGAPDCRVPVARFRWLPTRQPVVLDLWPNVSSPGGAPYTTITTWKNRGRDIVYGGETYFWSKHLEFAKFLDLPRLRSGQRFEIAAGMDAETRRQLVDHGWSQLDSLEISRDPAAYRDYIQRSRAEFTVAKDQNIRLRSGWFSDRSASYLAAARPVINQETGFSNILPVGKGLFAFSTIEDILAAVDAIESDYEGNRRAAREIAAEYFAAEKVLGSLLARAGL